MATTADILTGLRELDKDSDDFPQILHGMLQSDEYYAFTSALEGHEEIEFLDFLDQGSEYLVASYLAFLTSAFFCRP